MGPLPEYPATPPNQLLMQFCTRRMRSQGLWEEPEYIDGGSTAMERHHPYWVQTAQWGCSKVTHTPVHTLSRITL